MVESGAILSDSILDSPFWTMCVDIHQGNPDRVETRFNPELSLPFETKGLDVLPLLPLEEKEVQE